MSISCFVRCDLNGTVEETYWSDPISLAIPQVTNMGRLFDRPGHKEFLEALSQTLEHQEHVLRSQTLLDGDGASASLFLFHQDRNVWILLTDVPVRMQESSRKECDRLAFRMIRHVASSYEHHRMQDSQAVYTHFEQIQRLNNELVNTHRELLRANRKLETLNEELNNRLVKDPLTGLVSRYQYRSEMFRLIDADPEGLGVFAFIDIDNFKQVNDTYGHGAGDAYLIEFSRRLASISLSRPAICMRIAGDEFGIYWHGLDTVDEMFASRLWDIVVPQLLANPIGIGELALPVSCSIGLAIYNRDTRNVHELVEFADWAMYTAKRSGKNACRMFDLKTYLQRNAKG